MKGPDVPTEYYFSFPFFPSVINSTTIVIIEDFNFGQVFSNFVCVDVPTNTWTPYPNLPFYFMPQTTLASTVSFDKNGKRYDEKWYYKTWKILACNSR